MYNLESSITHAKSSKPPRMFHRDAVDTSPDFGGRNVLKTFEMAIRHNWRTTRTELESEFSLAGSIFTYLQKYFLAHLRGWG